jgi:hypothetical protein
MKIHLENKPKLDWLSEIRNKQDCEREEEIAAEREKEAFLEYEAIAVKLQESEEAHRVAISRWKVSRDKLDLARDRVRIVTTTDS